MAKLERKPKAESGKRKAAQADADVDRAMGLGGGDPWRDFISLFSHVGVRAQHMEFGTKSRGSAASGDFR
jgi:hypothetical protein